MSERISIPVKWIDNRLDALDDEIDQLHRRLNRLEVEKALLQEWRMNPPGDRRARDALDRPDRQRPSEHAVTGWPEGGLPGPSDAVDRLVEEDPGLTSEELVDEALERGINSSADNKRGVLRTAVRRRLRNGDLVEDDGGGLWPKEHPNAKLIAENEENEGEEENGLPF